MKLISIYNEDHQKLMMIKIKNKHTSVAEVIKEMLEEMEKIGK